MYVTLAVNIPTLKFCAATLTSGLQITSDFGSVGCPSSSWPFQHLLYGRTKSLSLFFASSTC